MHVAATAGTESRLNAIKCKRILTPPVLVFPKQLVFPEQSVFPGRQPINFLGNSRSDGAAIAPGGRVRAPHRVRPRPSQPRSRAMGRDLAIDAPLGATAAQARPLARRGDAARRYEVGQSVSGLPADPARGCLCVVASPGDDAARSGKGLRHRDSRPELWRLLCGHRQPAGTTAGPRYSRVPQECGREELRFAPPCRGTSGWQYRDWRGEFYPPAWPTSRWLEFYAARVGAVENNGTFYRLAAPHHIRLQWRARTPPGFVMAIKASRYLTPRPPLASPPSRSRGSMAAAAGLGGRSARSCSSCRRHCRAAPIALAELPGRIHPPVRTAGIPTSVPHRVCVESRHPSWLTDEVKSILAEATTPRCAGQTGRAGH